jgi:hypothetical protein
MSPYIVRTTVGLVVYHCRCPQLAQAQRPLRRIAIYDGFRPIVGHYCLKEAKMYLRRNGESLSASELRVSFRIQPRSS